MKDYGTNIQLNPDTELAKAVEQLKNGDKDGFPVFYQETYRYIYARAKCICSNEQDALELMQEVYLIAYKNIKSLHASEALYGWLKTITLRQGASMLKKKNKEYLLPEESEMTLEEMPDETAELEENYLDKQDLDTIRSCVERLSDDQRAVILAYYYENMKVEEIGEVFSISAGTVKSRLYLARKKLKNYLEEEEKKQGYTFHSFGAVTLVLVLRSLLKENMYQAEKNSALIYQNLCQQIGIASAVTTTTTASKTATTATKTAAQTAKSVGKTAAGLGAKKAVITIVSAVAVTALVGTAAIRRNVSGDQAAQTEKDPVVEEVTVTPTMEPESQEVTEEQEPAESEEDKKQEALDAYEELIASGITENGVEINYYTYLDLNQDDIPELFVSNGPGNEGDLSEGELYTYRDDQVVYCGTLGNNYTYFYCVNDKYVMGYYTRGNRYVGTDEYMELYEENYDGQEQYQIFYDENYEKGEDIDESKFLYYCPATNEVEGREDSFIQKAEVIKLKKVEDDATEGEMEERVLYQTDQYELSFPLSWEDHYIVEKAQNGGINVYNKENREEFGGGWLFSIDVYERRDEFEDFPSYEILEEKNGKYYIADYPTDVQFSAANEKIYREMEADTPDVVKTIEVY